MIKGSCIALLVLVIAWQIDEYLTFGKYTDAALAMIRQMRHSFG
jgi:hypothetical protein